MLHENDKLMIAITPAGAIVGLAIAIGSQGYIVGNPLNLNVMMNQQGQPTGNMQLSMFLFPCEKMTIPQAMVIYEDDMERAFKTQIRKTYEAFMVKAKTGLIVPIK